MTDDQPEVFDVVAEVNQWIERAKAGEVIVVPRDFYGIGRWVTISLCLELRRIAKSPSHVHFRSGFIARDARISRSVAKLVDSVIP